MHVYRHSIAHTIFPGFHLRAFTHISLERERGEKRRKKEEKNAFHTRKCMYTGVLSHNYSRFSREGFYTHTSFKKLFTQGNACIQSFFHTILPDFHGRAFTHTLHSRNSFYTRKCMYTLFSHNPSTFSCEGFYTHITQETLFTQENECIKAFFSTQFSIFIRWLLHIYAL